MEYNVNGKIIVVENGNITINGKLAMERITSFAEISEAPAEVQKQCAKAGVNPLERVYIANGRFPLIVPREVAEEAVRQTRASDPDNIIEGLRELKKAYGDYNTYCHALDRHYDSGSAVFKGEIPIEPSKIASKYPLAAAYLEAETFANANPASNSGYEKSKAGKKACERILAGENPEEVLVLMKEEAAKGLFNN